MRQQGRFNVALVAQVDILLAALALYASCLLRSNVLPKISSVWAGSISMYPQYPLLLLGTLPILVGSLYLAGAYQVPRLHSARRIFYAIAKAFVLAMPVVLALGFVLRDQTFSRAIVFLYLGLSYAAFFTLRFATHLFVQRSYLRGKELDKAIIVGTGPGAQTIARGIEQKKAMGLQIVGFVDLPGERDADADVPTLGTVEELPGLVDVNVVDEVIFASSLDETARFERVIWKLEETGKTVHLRGDALGALLSRTYIGDFEGMPILTLQSVPADPVALNMKRAIDFVGSMIGLVVLSPLLLGAALAIRLNSPGPVFHRQERLGLNGRRFQMFKFRSMSADADARKEELAAQNEMSGPVFKMAHDPRVTSVGKWLRRFSVDELPQLWNVLKGDMSLVGPRPPLPHEVDEYIRWQRRRLSMKPGITCLWQVNGRNDLDFDTWMKLDMEYIDNWSLALDLKILLRTIPVVLSAKGAH